MSDEDYDPATEEVKTKKKKKTTPKKKRGRPPKKTTAKKKRGRPVGSKNKKMISQVELDRLEEQMVELNALFKKKIEEETKIQEEEIEEENSQEITTEGKFL